MRFIQTLIQVIKSKLTSNRKVSVMYGYPKGSNVWLTVYHKRKLTIGFLNGMTYLTKVDRRNGKQWRGL